MKLLGWIVLIGLVYWALRTQAKRSFEKRAKRNFDAHTAAQNTARPATSAAPAENMVACMYCQLYLPASEAIQTSDAHHFCSQEHARLYSESHKSTQQPTE